MTLLDNFQDVLNKPMDRGDFLKHIGIAGLLVMGGGMIAKSLVSSLGGSRGISAGVGSKNMAAGYGSNIYGGNKVNKAA